MNFSLGYSTELEVFNISMIIERQREGIMLFLRSYNTHTIIYIQFLCTKTCVFTMSMLLSSVTLPQIGRPLVLRKTNKTGHWTTCASLDKRVDNLPGAGKHGLENSNVKC